MIAFENIIAHEMVGLRAKISNSSNKQIVGHDGIIVDETKSMFLLDTRNGFKLLSKKESTWKLYVNGNKTTLHGSILQRRSYDRLEIKI